MTDTADITLQQVLDQANPNNLPDALRLVKLGHMFAPIKVVVTTLDADATVDVTSALVLADSVVTGITLADGEMLPAIGIVRSLRVTASGTAGSLGTYGITDPDGTAIVPPGGAGASMGIAELSDDGTTITFPNTVTGFVLTYIPRSYTDLDTTFENGI